MSKKRFLFSLLVISTFLISLVPFSESAVLAQSDNCFWQLTSETPKSFTVSTAPEASSSVSGTTVTVNWEGLRTTHTWSHPGSTLKPGDSLEMDVSVDWSVSSGNALNSSGGLRTSFYFNTESVSAGRNSISFNAEKSGSVSNSASFTIPSGSKEGATLSMYGYGDAAVGSGRVDYKYVYKCATPTPTLTPTKTRTPTRTITPTKCPADTEEKKLAEIKILYFQRIPKGKASTGEENNIYDFFGYAGYAEFTCGGYQSKVLDFLNELKFSKNPCERELMDKWDYGPIQAWFGYHQAVVIYPKGTDWQKTGTVLDPWPTQKPTGYSAEEWALFFSSTNFTPVSYIGERVLGANFIGIGPSGVYKDGKAYPIVGGDYKDPLKGSTTITFSEQEYKYIQALPADKREAFKKLPKPDQKRWLQVVMKGGEKVQKTIAHCPLNLYIVDPDGKRSGISGTEIFTELSDVSFMVLKLTDGTNYTEITYPENAGYTLVLEGTDKGQSHVFSGHTLLLGEQIPPVQQYSFTAEKNAIYEIATERLGVPMQWEGGSLEPEAVTEISVDFLESLPSLASPGAELVASVPVENESDQKPGLFDWKPPLWLGVLILLLGLFVFAVAAVIVVAKFTKNKKQQTLPDGQTKSQKNQSLIWVLLIGLMLIGCLVSSCGIFGLVVNLRKTPESSQLPEMDQTLSAIKATEMSLAQKVTESSQIQLESPEPSQVVAEPPTLEPTQTPTPEPTQTPVPTLTFTPTTEPSPTAVSGTGNQYLDDYRIVDDFSSNTFGWPEMDDGRKILKFEEGGYSFQLKEKDGFDVVYLPVTFKPSEILFDVRGIEGDQDGTFGVFCHFQDENNYYYVEFDMLTKTYVIAQSLDGEYIPLTAQTDSGQYWHDAESFKEPTDVNKISVGCYLGNIYVLVNDVLVDDVMITQPFTEKGWTALFVYTYDFAGDEGYKVIFDNLEAYEPRQ